MHNFSNDNASVETMLIGLVFSLTFSSLVIAFLLFNAYGYQVTGSEKVISPYGNEALPTQDYTTNTISNQYNYELGTGKWVYHEGIGRVLEDNTILEAWLFLDWVNPISDTYTVTYKLNNSVKQNYAVAVRYSGSDLADIVVDVENDGFHIDNPFLPMFEYNFYPYSSPNQVIKPTIKTVFYVPSEGKCELKFYFNNQLVFTKSDIDKVSFLGLADTEEGGYKHAGVMSYTNGFTVESISTTSIGTTGTTGLGTIASFLEILFAIVVWNVNPMFLPWELNVLFIKTQLFAVVACIAVIVRG